MAAPDKSEIKGLASGTELHPLVLQSYEALGNSKEDPKRGKWDKNRIQAWEAVENNMYTGDEKAEMRKEGMIPLVINKIQKGVQGSTAIATDNKPNIQIFPLGSADLYVADLIKRGIDFVWEQNNGNDVSFNVVEESKVGGMGLYYARFNEFKGPFGRIEIDEFNPPDCYWSSTSKKANFADSEFVLARLRSKRYLQDRYGIKDEDLHPNQKLPEHIQKTWGITGGDNYLEAQLSGNREEESSDKTKKPMRYWEIEAWLLKTFKEHWVINRNGWAPIPSSVDDPEEYVARYGGRLFERRVEKRVQCFIIGAKLLSSLVNPYGVDSDGDPVLPLITLPHTRTRSSYPMSPTMYAIDINKEKNKRRAQLILLTSHSVNSPVISEKGTLVWSKGGPSKAGSSGEVEKGSAFVPYRLVGGTSDASRLIEVEMRADADLDDVFDMHDVMRGKIPKGTDPSGRVVLALQDMGGMMSRPFQRKSESAVVRVGKVTAVLMLRHWPRPMWERLVEDSELNDETVVDKATGETSGERWQQALERVRPQDYGRPSDVTLVDFDIKVVAGSMMPTNRIAKSLLAMEYVQSGIYRPKDALEYIDDPNKDKIIAEIEREGQMKQALASITGKEVK